MSSWTHITACFSVDTGLAEPKSTVKRIVQKELKKAPKMTGSEGDADVFVNVQSGYDYFIGRDCGHCLHYVKNKFTEDDTVCDAPEDYECPEGKYQTRVVISIQGDLRDMTKEQTQKEFDEFYKFLERRYLIRDYTVNIEGDC